MKVILLSDVKKQGKKDDIIEVSDGYAKNFLIKNNLAVPATKTSTKILNDEITTRKLNEQELIKECNKTKEKVLKLELKFKVKTGAMDKVFGNISSKQICDELNKNSFNIDKKQVHIIDSLDTLGYHNVEIELHKKVKFNIKIELVK